LIVLLTNCYCQLYRVVRCECLHLLFFGTFQIPVDSFGETSGGGMVMIAMK
jgi:hypothetical protein